MTKEHKETMEVFMGQPPGKLCVPCSYRDKDWKLSLSVIFKLLFSIRVTASFWAIITTVMRFTTIGSRCIFFCLAEVFKPGNTLLRMLLDPGYTLTSTISLLSSCFLCWPPLKPPSFILSDL
uniref:Uncharacterized protein n=1 Tax=Ditylenchus dipsaci TaxID=166011 RepID=A0A915E4G0_9BILA